MQQRERGFVQALNLDRAVSGDVVLQQVEELDLVRGEMGVLLNEAGKSLVDGVGVQADDAADGLVQVPDGLGEIVGQIVHRAEETGSGLIWDGKRGHRAFHLGNSRSVGSCVYLMRMDVVVPE